MSNDMTADLPTMELYGETLAHRGTMRSLLDRVKRKLDDPSYSDDDILDVLNEGLLWIAGKYDLSVLDTTTDVTTDPTVNQIPFPADYMRNLRWCHSITHNRPVKVYPSVPQLYRMFSVLDQEGQVIGIAEKGRRIFYQRVPTTAETLRINYFKYPEPVDWETEKIECLPPHLSDQLMISYCCKEIFDEIEDGVEGNKVNTMFHTAKWEKTLKDLEWHLGPPARLPVELAVEIDWESFLCG